MSRKHNPEFTMMECYQAYADYRDMMDLAEAMIRDIARAVCGGEQVPYQGGDDRLRWALAAGDAARQAPRGDVGIDMLEHADLESLLRGRGRRRAAAHGDAPTWGKLVDDLFSEHVEPKLVQPIFITDYPVEISPLAKRSPDDPRLVERFEVFIAGMEIGNAFSELNDPDDQRGGSRSRPSPAAPATTRRTPSTRTTCARSSTDCRRPAASGVGVDRLVMILGDAPNLREVILFPHLRPESEA